MPKTGIAGAFRIVPLHPLALQYCLFGFVWRTQFCYDRCLPMGCGLPDTVPISVSVTAWFVLHLHSTGYLPATVASHISAMAIYTNYKAGVIPQPLFFNPELIVRLPQLNRQLDLRKPIDKPLLSRLLGALEFTVPGKHHRACLLYTSPSPRDISGSRMPSSA